MLRPFLTRRSKIARGFYRTRIRGHRQAYAADTWWDQEFFTSGLSDRQTIAPEKNVLTAAYHYASVELHTLRYLCRNRADLRSASICDLGSGSGHWIDFYLSLGASRCDGLDVSRKAVEFLEQKYPRDDRVSIHHGRIHEVLARLSHRYDLVNAIGIMFHLVDDEEWRLTIHQVAGSLEPGGLFVVGGHFGWLDNLNVQFDSKNRVNKRLRSAWRWRRCLKDAGFGRIQIQRNRAYLGIPDSLPENNVLIARKD
jgi:Methyltransferase domain